MQESLGVSLDLSVTEVGISCIISKVREGDKPSIWKSPI